MDIPLSLISPFSILSKVFIFVTYMFRFIVSATFCFAKITFLLQIYCITLTLFLFLNSSRPLLHDNPAEEELYTTVLRLVMELNKHL